MYLSSLSKKLSISLLPPSPSLSLLQKAEDRPSFAMIYAELRRMSNEKDDYSDVVDEG